MLVSWCARHAETDDVGQTMILRVLHVLTSNDRRGAQISALLVRDELARRGHRAEAVALTGEGGGTRLDIPTLGPSRMSIQSLTELRRRARSADVVIAHGSTTLTACAVALRRNNPPFAYANIGDLSYWAGHGAKRLRVQLLLRRAAAVAARSDASRESLHTNYGVPRDRVRIIPNGRPAQLYPRTDADRRLAARRELGLPAHGPVVAWVGSLSPEKRPDLAVAAIARMNGVTLALAGDGPERDRVAEQVARVAPGRVHLLGAVDSSAPTLAAADALLLTSDSEGLPGVLIEAGLTGIPVVATRVGFVDEVVADGVTGRLVSPGRDDEMADALAAVLADAPAMGERAYARCTTEFSITRVADRWESMLVDMVERSGGLRERSKQ